MAKTTLPASIERRLHTHSEIQHTLNRLEGQTAEKTPRPFVTLSRQYGCNAYDLAERLAERLSITFPSTEFTVYDRKTVELLTESESITSSVVQGLSERSRGMIEDWVAHMVVDRPPDIRVFRRLAETVCSVASLGQAVIVGRGGAAITQHIPNGIHVRLVASIEWRIRNLNTYHNRSDLATVEEVEQADREREGFVLKYLGIDVNDPHLYHATLNSEHVAVEDQVDIIAMLMRREREMGFQM